ncbi:hypothetical protein [Oharaeibacter diazotrophicus]|uniref:Uncharacterized protein n=1 Tax=Oharaeibacter diazotrophicus TaxID=1920512 RepID=A0A4R6RGA9_9HYPH|nr:hypothetical protein [Oharaeibacter diazotrophicus]TDP85373.1 hypothetical protein EDD54_2226 [Oharaeibacter diazotrophicus]BBE74343.1 hypothetical protein OHA_1_03974 [Pleomorphomonas sp. SM30]GLS75964.1 hypothetical protein GCM10007904_12990 [Oharaeibacter diazotrophicus]
MCVHPISDAATLAVATPLAVLGLTAVLAIGGYAVALWCGLARQRAVDADLAELGE